jgi:hypothetical protein
MTPVDTLGEPVTVVNTLGEPVVLINNDGTPAFLAYSAKTYLGGVAPYHWLDFINNRALYASVDVGAVTQATGYSFTRASEGYYTNADGTLTNFASGALRRGDRGVLIEGARTNLQKQSGDQSSAEWTSTNFTPTRNLTTPDGLANSGCTLNEGAATGVHQFVTAGTNRPATGAVPVTQSVMLQFQSSMRYCVVSNENSGNGYNVVVDLQAGTITQNATTGTGWTYGGSSIRALSGGWYLVTLTGTPAAAAGVLLIVYGATSSTSARAESYTGTSRTIGIWGAQLEAASFASSYIPTVAAAATRASDVLFYTAGTSAPLGLWAEFERVVDTGAAEGLLGCSDNTFNNFMVLQVNSSDLFEARTDTAAVPQALISVAGALPLATVIKGAARFETNNFQAVKNGTLGTADISGTPPSGATRLTVGSYHSGSQLFGYVRKVAVTNFGPTDAQLQLMAPS